MEIRFAQAARRLCAQNHLGYLHIKSSAKHAGFLLRGQSAHLCFYVSMDVYLRANKASKQTNKHSFQCVQYVKLSSLYVLH